MLAHPPAHQVADEPQPEGEGRQERDKAGNERSPFVGDADPQPAANARRPEHGGHEGEHDGRAKIVHLLVDVVNPTCQRTMSRE